MKRIFSVCLMSVALWLGACSEDDSVPGGEDCRRALNACADGYRCLQTGNGTFDCVPGRDADVPPPDAFAVPDPDMAVSDAAVDLMDATAGDASVAEQPDAEEIPSSDSEPMDSSTIYPDTAVTEPDAARPVDDAEPLEEDAAPPPMPDAAPVIDAAAPPIDIDMGVEPDEGVPPVVDMGRDEDFGPGRCNYDGLHPREAEDLGRQQQPGNRIEPGVYADLTVGGADWADWYRIEVCPGGRLGILVNHTFDGVDIQLDVWQQGEGRIREQNGVDSENGQCTGREAFDWRNDGDDPADIRFNVYPWAPAGRDGNNTYDLTLRLDGCD